MPNFRNGWTGEELAETVEVCHGCTRNFLDTKSGDAHRIGTFGVNRRCATPDEANLKKLVNQYGSVIYARKSAKKPRGYKVVTSLSSVAKEAPVA
jgi:hypothetical protein